MPVPQGDLIHELPDRRQLGYCCYGDREGHVVITLHGTPGSRLKFAVADGEAKRLGLRLISPDRWGYGLSEAPRTRAELADYAADIDSLLGELGVERFSVVGVSGGGPYAAAVAAVFGDRVSGLALVAPVAPVDRADRRQGVGVFHQFAFRVLPRLPGCIALVFSGFRGLLAVAPWLAIQTIAVRAGRADRALLSEREISADLAESFRAGLARDVRGPQIDMTLFSGDWKLDLASVAGRSRMWLGRQDRNIPLAAARKVASAIPRLELIEIDNAGHYWIVRNYSDVLGWIAGGIGVDGGMRDSKHAGCEQAGCEQAGPVQTIS